MMQCKFKDLESNLVHGGIMLDNGDIICACCRGIIERDECGCCENYDMTQTKEALREALININGGSTVLDYRKIRNGEYKALSDECGTWVDFSKFIIDDVGVTKTQMLEQALDATNDSLDKLTIK